MQSLFEKYRPARWEEVIGQEKAVKVLRRLQDKGGFGGRAYWITGPSGVGKTTLARIIANDIAESWHVEEVDAQDCTLDFIRQMEVGFAYKGMGEKTGKAWIVNEADDLSAKAIARLKTALEPIPAHVAIIFTCTRESAELLWEDSEDAPQFLSRCVPIKLAERGLADAFAERLHQIADAEGLNGKPAQAYKRLAMDKRNNMRAMLSALEAGEMIADE